MSWRDLEKKRIEQVRTVDQQEVVLQLEGGELAKITAQAPATTGESDAELHIEIQKAAPPERSAAPHATTEEETMVKDPVCQMTIEPEHAAATSEYKGKTYYFCAVGCKAEFDRDPEKYADKGGTPSP